MSFVFQNGNVGDLEKRIEVLEAYHNESIPKNVYITSETGQLVLTESGLNLKTE